MKILTSNVLDKIRWCTVVRKFSHSCLLWAQEPGYGPSIDDLNNAFDRLAKLSLTNLEKAFAHVDQWSSDPLIKKIFQFKMPKEAPEAPGGLFKLVMLNNTKYKPPLWIQLEECSTLQIGLKICWSETHDFDNILAQFTTYRPSILTFNTVVQFWTWWHQSPQVNLFSGLKWNGPAHNSLIKLGKMNLEEQFPAVYAEDVTTPIMISADEAQESSLPSSIENELIDLTSTPTHEEHLETVLFEESMPNTDDNAKQTARKESMPKKNQTKQRNSATTVPKKTVRSKKSSEKNQPTKQQKSASRNANAYKKTSKSLERTTKRKKSLSMNGREVPHKENQTKRKKSTSSDRIEATIPSKTKVGKRKRDQPSGNLAIDGLLPMNNIEVSVIPVFLKSGLKDVTKVNEAFKRHGVIMVKNFLPSNVIPILDELFERYFLTQTWSNYIIGSQFKTIEVHGHGKLLVENENTKRLEKILQQCWDPFVAIFEGTQNYVPSETQILRGPSRQQSVHVDSLFSTLSSIIFMKDDCDVTKFVNLESYGFSYKDLSTAYDQNLDPSDLGSGDEYGDEFSLEFLQKFYPQNSAVFKKNPICMSSPLA
jgi:hypothetical protein